MTSRPPFTPSAPPFTLSASKGVLLLSLVSLAACECGPTTNRRLPKFELPADDGSERTLYDFGQVQVGATTTARLRVRNGGASLLTLDTATTSAPFAVVGGQFPVSVAAGDDGSFEISFSPTVADQRETGTLTVTSDDPNRKSVTVQLAGTGITAVARGSPSPLAFGDVYVGESKSVTLTITNAGSNALDVQLAEFQGSPPSVTGNLASLVGSIPGGMSKTVDVAWAPAAEGALAGAVHLTMPASQGGALDVPLTGRGIQAIPKLCFKFDDTGLETCADATSPAVTVAVGSLCDNRLYGAPDAGALQCTTLTGQRSGKLYYRNDGNVQVRYSVQYQPLPYLPARCSGTSTQTDFAFGNSDGGTASFTTATVPLPAMVTDAKPWESSPIAITYRPTSLCREDAADQARVLWTRQGEPAGTTRAPGTMFLTITGASKLPRGLPADMGFGAAGSPATVPFSQDFVGTVNAGDAPLVVNAVELWEELPSPFPADSGMADAGGPNGGIFQPCGPSLNSDCARFAWTTDGGDPNLRTPFIVDAGSATTPAQAVMGRLTFAPLGSGACVNNGVACPNTLYRIYAVIRTNDPYTPAVVTRLQGVAQ
jgi:Abnormal spindle-like microcephaly-assoc'd, ASPM-SPD-2-Hydin